MQLHSTFLRFVALLTLCACSGAGPHPTVVGDGDAGASNSSSRDGGSGADSQGDHGDGDEGEASSSLKAHIERDRVTVTVVTLACDGACADVVAVAEGGSPPYAFAWEDGSRNPARHVCPSANTHYEVTVTDSSAEALEFAGSTQTAVAQVRAELLNCAGDGGAPHGNPGDICLDNGTFAGTPQINVFGTQFDAKSWSACASTPDIYDSSMLTTPPTDGPTALHLSNGPSEAVSQQLCAPLREGKTYSMEIDLLAFQGAPELAVYGGTASCGKTQPLWHSAPTTTSWKTSCFEFTPSQELSHLVLDVVTNSEYGRIVVDNLVPVEACP
ncbi:MAG: hypothetical protein QM778_35185 [Myxococcales bacterium]